MMGWSGVMKKSRDARIRMRWRLGGLGGLVRSEAKTARQQGEWPQGRPGQKPQEDHRRPPQRAASAPRPAEKIIET